MSYKMYIIGSTDEDDPRSKVAGYMYNYFSYTDPECIWKWISYFHFFPDH